MRSAEKGISVLLLASIALWGMVRYFIAAPAARAAVQSSYQTNFPATQNPISESGAWLNGAAQGTDWGNAQTTPGHVFGTNTSPGCPGIPADCNDSTASLAGTWPADQSACATVSIGSALNRAGAIYEVEIKLRQTITAHSITGYEFNYSMFANGNQYMQIVRWNGAVGNFTVLLPVQSPGGTPPIINNGDVLCASAVGTTLTSWVLRNGALLVKTTIADSGITSGGAPGVGFFNLGLVGDNQNFGFSTFQAEKYYAQTANQVDVNAVINGPIRTAADGDTIGIPPGNVPWITGVTVPANIGIQIIGAGQGITTITDKLTAGRTMFSMTPTFGNSLSRLSGMSLIPFQPTTGYGSPVSVVGTCTAGGCPDFRMDHLTAPENWAGSNIADDSFAVISNMFGVADHNTVGDSSGIRGGNGLDFINIAHGAWKGVGGWGDNSWASADTFGTNQAFYCESNNFTNAFCYDSDTAGASFGGGRFVCRFNTFNGVTGAGACTGHGTDTTGRTRGVRQWEAYDNVGTCTSTSIGCGSAWPGRSGVGKSFANAFTNVGGGFMKGLANLDPQRRWRPDNPWGGCGGLGAFDTNDGVTYFSGTVGTVSLGSGNYTINDSGSPAWTINQWSPLGSPYSFFDVTQNFPYENASNTASALLTQTTGSNLGPPAVNVPATGNSYQILRATLCLDQPTRSGGNLVKENGTGNNPVLVSTGLPGPVNESLDPTYEAADALPPTANVTIVSNTRSLMANRDFYVESVNQAAQTSSSSPFNGASGHGHGTLANRPATCTPAVGYWATDQGTWNQNGGPQGVQYTCTALNTWTLTYTPFCFPHPLITGGVCASSGSPAVSLNPGSLSFGNILVGSTSAVRNVTLTNTGGALLMIGGITITGTNPTDFAQTNNCGTGVLSGGSCTIAVTFTPLSAASFSASVSISDNASGSPQTVPLTGTGITATAGISFAPTSVPFAALTVGTSSAPTAVTVTNTGSGTLTISNVIISGGNATSFTQTNNCTSVAPAGTCTINVTFKPQAAGALTSSVSVTDNAPASPQSVPISGTGLGVPSISFTPSSLPFGNQTVSGTTAALSTTVKNIGTGTLTLSSVTLTGANAADFAISANTCSGSLTVNSTCVVSATFTPGATGSRIANLTFTDNAAGSPQNVALTGTGTQAGAGFSPTSLNFANQNVNSTSAPLTTTLTNTGSATLNISSITITGTNASDFAISAKTCAATLAASGTCTVSVTFTPAATGARSANLSFADNAPASPQTVPLTGMGNGSSISIAPASLTFPATVVGQPSAAQVLTVTNTGNVNLTVSSIAVAGDFAQTNNCIGTLMPGQFCFTNVTFTPTAAGLRSSTVVFTDTAASSPQSVAVSGTGTQAGAVVSPVAIAFPNTPVSTTSSAQNATLTNNGTATLNISSIALGGTDPSYFTISANTCGATLAVATSCTVSVTFTPQTAITASATLSFTDSGPGSPQVVTLTGTGTFVAVSFNPASVTFPNTPVSTPSASIPVILTNNGNGTLAIASITITGANASNFTQTNNCGASVAGGGSCTINVRFTPSAIGSRTASISVADNAAGSPQTVSLQGQGFTPAPLVSLSRASINFADQTISTPSNPQVVILQNTGTASLTITSTSITGANPGDFGSSTTCGGALAVNAACTYTFIFTPTGAGSRAATFNLVTNAASSPDTIALSGNGLAGPNTTPAPQMPFGINLGDPNALRYYNFAGQSDFRWNLFDARNRGVAGSELAGEESGSMAQRAHNRFGRARCDYDEIRQAGGSPEIRGRKSFRQASVEWSGTAPTPKGIA